MVRQKSRQDMYRICAYICSCLLLSTGDPLPRPYAFLFFSLYCVTVQL